MRFADVKASANGRWAEILQALSSGLEPAMQRPGRHVACPMHGGRDGFRVFRDVEQTGGGICNTCGSHADGFALLGWINGWSDRDALKAVAGYLGIDDDRRPTPTPAPRKPIPQTPPADTSKTEQRIRAIWSESHPIAHDGAEPLRQYLIARGLGAILDDAPRDIRLHPALGFWFRGSDARFQQLATLPAMVALVRNSDGRVRGLHRTYLQADGSGKARIEDPETQGEMLPAKKLMSLYDRATNGCGAQLYPVTMRELAVAEGIETALAVRLATGLPVWSTISAAGMSRLRVSGVDRLIVFGDRDEKEAGQKAARKLAGKAAMEGVAAKVVLPDEAGVDWLDVLLEESTS